MTHSQFLEDFSGSGVKAATTAPTAGADTAALRASFDEGYKCGWQDADAAHEDRDAEARDSLASALQAMNFTYFEARQHVMQSIRPVLQAMVDAVLPALLSDSLGGRIVEALGDVAEKAETSVTIACAPDNEEMLSALLKEHVNFPVTVEAEPTLTSSQAVVHLDDGQIHIDLDATLEAIRDATKAFFEDPEEKEMKHA